MNNKLAVLPFVGVLAVQPPHPGGPNWVVDGPAEATLVPGGPRTHPRYGWRSYVPFIQSQVTVLTGRLMSVEDRALAVIVDGRRIQKLDRFGNPCPGPNEGRDLSLLRTEFMRTLSGFAANDQVGSAAAVVRARDLAVARFGPLLEEPAYLLLLDLKTARALARTGALDSAGTILRTSTARTVNPELNYRLAHIEAISGNLGRATSLLTGMITAREINTRSNFDGPHLLLRVGAEARDPEAVEIAIARLSDNGNGTGRGEIAASLRARVHLWWDELNLDDLSVRSWGRESAGKATACLGRWRMGQSTMTDADAMAAFAQAHRDAAPESRVARAAALIGTGNPQAGSAELSTLIEELRYSSRDDFLNHQLFDLARALRVVALESAGETEQAAEDGERLIEELTPGVLPAILTGEVLERLQGSD